MVSVECGFTRNGGLCRIKRIRHARDHQVLLIYHDVEKVPEVVQNATSVLSVNFPVKYFLFQKMVYIPLIYSYMDVLN